MISMKLLEVYKKFGSPPNLQEHMLRVNGIVSFLEKHWTGEPLDWRIAKKAAMLHDLGNIVKLDFVKYAHFLGDEIVNLEQWKNIQTKMIEAYGTDDHEATIKMLNEIRAEREIVEIISNKSFARSVDTKNSNNWSLKILYYADLRTLPSGIGTTQERLDDVKKRLTKYTNRPDFEDLVNACSEIEKQIQENLNVPVSEINDQNVIVDKSLLTNFEV